MCKASILILSLLFCLPSLADVYMSPEDHYMFAKYWLNGELSKVPADKYREAAEKLLANIPQERRDLEEKVAQAKASPYPGSYMLSKGFDSLDYHEKVLKDWLQKPWDPASGPKERSWLPTKPQPAATPAGTASPKPTLADKGSQNTEPGLPTRSSAPSATGLIACALIGAGVLLGARRALYARS